MMAEWIYQAGQERKENKEYFQYIIDFIFFKSSPASQCNESKWWYASGEFLLFLANNLGLLTMKLKQV